MMHMSVRWHSISVFMHWSKSAPERATAELQVGCGVHFRRNPPVSSATPCPALFEQNSPYTRSCPQSQTHNHVLPNPEKHHFLTGFFVSLSITWLSVFFLQWKTQPVFYSNQFLLLKEKKKDKHFFSFWSCPQSKMPPPTSRAEHLTSFPHWCRCGKHIPVSRWAVSDWHVFLLLPAIYSRFIQRDIPCQCRCLLCLTWYLPALQQRHVCCRTPFLTGDTSAWRMWPIILLYASANSKARQDMDKILIYSKKGNSCVAPAASPSTSLCLRCCLSSLPCRHPTHILLSRTARVFLCTSERVKCLPWLCSARGKHFLWKSPSPHRLTCVTFGRWERGNRYVTVKKGKQKDTSYKTITISLF